MRSVIAHVTPLLCAGVVAWSLAAGCAPSAAPKPQASGTGGTIAGSGGTAPGSGGSGGDTTMGTGGATDAAPPSEGGTTVPDASGEAGGPSDLAGPSNLADLADLADDASVVGWAGVPGIEDLSTVKPTAGCGQDPGQALGSWVQHTIVTPMTRLGSITRTYFVKLPANYDRNKPYRLIYEGTSCGGGPTAVPDFTALAGADGVIAIAMQRRDGVHTDGPGGPNCFDDWNSMSIEYPFFETMHLAVSKTLCFDAHRVFIVGHSSGAWLSNNVGCYFGSKYIRAISPHEGGFSQQPNYPVYGPPPTGMPTCNDLPTPGLWQHNHDDPNNPISANIRAITRALKVNRCTDTDFATAKTTLYAAPGTNGVCKQYTSCPKEFPIVFCDPATGGHTGNMMFGAAWQFFKAF